MVDDDKNATSDEHYCAAGHSYRCAGECECICGLPMTGTEHSDCPREIRTCPAHEAAEDRTMPDSGFVEIDFSSVKPCAALPDCRCGCSEMVPGTGIGWCLHCDHVYADYNAKVENLHFAHYCPGAPVSGKQEARAGPVRR